MPKTWLTVPEGYKIWQRGREIAEAGQKGLFGDPAVKDVIMGGGSFDFGDSILTQSLTDAFGEKMGVPGKIMKRRTRCDDAQDRNANEARSIRATLQSGTGIRGREEWRARSLSYVQRRGIAQTARKHLDNVMGQIARDNLHTSNKFKDILGNIVAYPGWNIGTIRLFGGIGRGGYQLATGQALDTQARLALQYASGKILRAGLQGALMNKFITGEWPKNIAEIYTWPTGQKDSKGNWIRVSPPEYLARRSVVICRERAQAGSQ